MLKICFISTMLISSQPLRNGCNIVNTCNACTYWINFYNQLTLLQMFVIIRCIVCLLLYWMNTHPSFHKFIYGLLELLLESIWPQKCNEVLVSTECRITNDWMMWNETNKIKAVNFNTIWLTRPMSWTSQTASTNYLIDSINEKIE